MSGPARNWSLVVVESPDGRDYPPFQLKEGVNIIGRAPECEIRLDDNSVSRRHAEIHCEGDQIQIVNIRSRNGVIVNVIEREKAFLQPGDSIRLGAFLLKLLAAPAPEAPKAKLQVTPSVVNLLEQTARYVRKLPELQGERRLLTVFHICSWLTEDFKSSDEAVNRCLHMIIRGMDLLEAHYYDSQGRLTHWASAHDNKKATFKLARFLAGKFQVAPEAIIIPGDQFTLKQRNVEDFNFLVGPLKPAGSQEASPFILLIKESSVANFTAADRVMLNAICQIWTRVIGRIKRIQTLESENSSLRVVQPKHVMLGESAIMKDLRQQLEQAARVKANILLTGETGSGKEVAAYHIHYHSTRASGPFEMANCASIPETLFESELFGHVRGAFTDAKFDRRGKFEMADGGTLLLDEIGEMPMSVQSKLLRVLEDHSINKLGGESPLSVDVRLLAATNRDLGQMVRAGTFREDLFFRLDVLNIRVPSLAEHLEDIDILAQSFLNAFCAENGLAPMAIEENALIALKTYEWPGNVRQLRNVIQRCAVRAGKPYISLEAVQAQINTSPN